MLSRISKRTWAWAALVLGCLVIALSVFRTESFEPSEKCAMVIVEPRAHEHLQYVLENFDANMPPRYALYIFHGDANEAYAKECAAGVSSKKGRDVHFVNLHTDNLTADEYNALFKREWFWEAIDAENVLVFQTDAVLCSQSRRSIEEYEHLGYIGCAYDAVAGPGTHWGADAFWGVGGLSFRKKSAALRCIRTMPFSDADPEDVFFSNCVEAGIAQKPTDGLHLSGFCTQNTFLKPSFGAHRIHDQLPKDQLVRFLHFCPEAKPLVQI